jgi:NhaP-type Na+/H+ or K+/H+ antiporter
MQVILGPIVGIALGYVGARLLDTATERGWVSNSFQGIGILSLAAFTYVVSEMVGGNGFIATFVGGMVFGNSVRNSCTFLFEVMETEGQLLMLITFFVFGVALLPDAIAHMTPTMIVYALLSLTVIRMIPITLSLLGAGLRPPSWLFLGWFGPRGLASILFLLLILEETDLLHKESIFSVAVITVAISVVLHGITAAPFARAYGRLSKRMGDCEENRPVSAVAMRHGLPDE